MYDNDFQLERKDSETSTQFPCVVHAGEEIKTRSKNMFRNNNGSIVV